MNLIWGISLIICFVALASYARFGNRLKGLGFTFIVFAFVCWALFFPSTVISWGGFELKRLIVPLVQLILFGMGMTLTFGDFRRVLTMPKGVFICCSLQYCIMPVSAYVYAHLFGLQGAVATGLILVGSVPSGTASNVITLLARGNVPLSVTVTAVSTIISPLMTPLLMKVFAGTYVSIEVGPMVFSIFKLIIAPLILGMLILRYLPAIAKKCRIILPYLAMLAICVIIAVTIALSREELFKLGFALFGAAVCFNATGFLLGYWGGRLGGLNKTDARTTALEVGLQNGGMATGLAFGVLGSPLAALAAAVFGPWSAIAASGLASVWSRQSPEEPSSSTTNFN